jgi:hypothetical protein
MNIEYAIIVKNKTPLELLIERFNTKAQAKFYIERAGGSFEDYEIEHNNFHKALAIVQKQLSSVIKNKIIDRSFLPAFMFSEKQLILVVGQDGLVANAAKYVNGLPILAINPDPKRYDGVLLPFNPEDFIMGVTKVIQGKGQIKSVSLAEARLNDGQRLLAFNDLFIGASTHVSARYTIEFGQKKELHSSSGVIVSTKSGSTGWMSSILNMANGVQQFLTKENNEKRQLNFGEDELMFAVREPFKSVRTQVGITAGILQGGKSLILESHMPNNGIIFSDGIESDFLQFASGNIVSIGIAEETAKLVMRN